jgi:hypothetical protein
MLKILACIMIAYAFIGNIVVLWPWILILLAWRLFKMITAPVKPPVSSSGAASPPAAP